MGMINGSVGHGASHGSVVEMDIKSVRATKICIVDYAISISLTSGRLCCTLINRIIHTFYEILSSLFCEDLYLLVTTCDLQFKISIAGQEESYVASTNSFYIM